LRDVAAAAGVSIATASRVLGGSRRPVAPEYRERVLAAAATLRYTTDASARAMRRASDSITLVADDLTTPSIGMVVAAMVREVRTAGVFVTVSSTRATPERQLETVRLLRALRPRALVLTSGRIDAEVLAGRLRDELAAYRQEGGRVVIVGDTDMPFDSISFDNHAAAREVGAYLAETGHRRVVVLAGPAGQAAMSARAGGFVEGLQAGGVDPAGIRMVACQVSRDGGYGAVRHLVAEGLADTDAIVAGNDLIAIGAMSALRAAGVVVPGDLSVTGFDDIQLADDVTPRLTTVALPLAHAGAEAIRLALADRPEPTHLTIPGHLVVRQSTSPRTVDNQRARRALRSPG
jgi:LacI family transcriptional regulator